MAALALRAQKRALRRSMDKILRAIPDESLNVQSERITGHLLSSALIQRSQNIALFLSMPTAEPRTDALARALLERGKTLFVPRIVPADEVTSTSAQATATADDPLTHPSSSSDPSRALSPDPAPANNMQMLRVRDVADLESISPSGKWGLREPDPHGREAAPPGTLDLIIVPGVAFDGSKRPKRLGHGKGYYDIYISGAADALKVPTLVGIALSEQLLEEGTIPVDEHDRVMDAVVTPLGFYPEEPPEPAPDTTMVEVAGWGAIFSGLF
ncbi:5-formyltetrahydrofolate cyclo-ligase [Exidia glandulosa HHB12029]|uniref:5-formyltetrahydrofolate cyclo-ligase n=1 Tax=Exidia glandulosa HHB12029 TaxID=1314781 RepID=A0A165MLT5_EXIGL|nr:5-formyltetrahydrofolate cyclo-ligase [Exidia glandulosa HHB12029]